MLTVSKLFENLGFYIIGVCQLFDRDRIQTEERKPATFLSSNDKT